MVKKYQNSGYLWEAGVGWEWELPEKGHEGIFGMMFLLHILIRTRVNRCNSYQGRLVLLFLHWKKRSKGKKNCKQILNSIICMLMFWGQGIFSVCYLL